MSSSRLWSLPLMAAALILLGCLAPAQRADAEGSGAVSERSIRFGGEERSYRLYRPANLPAGKPVPLLVALHGGFGTGKVMEDMTHFDNVADEHGFMVAYPDGISRAWNAGSCCAKPMKNNTDDVGFVRAMIADVKASAAIDGRRVYGTGFSNGSMLLHRIACEAPDTFTAIAAVSGGIMIQNCATRRSVPALLIQGRDDPRIPWDGGVFEGSYRPSISELVKNLAARNECSSNEDLISDDMGVQCRTLRGCKSGSEVSWCGLRGVGHQWAGGRTFLPRLLGKNNDNWDTSERIWKFFSRYPNS